MPPTCVGLKVRTPAEAHIIFHAVLLNILPMVTRRLDTDERRNISSGNVFVWEERGPSAEANGLGIERWTDSIHWGPSRVKEEFLLYHEKKRDTGAGNDTAPDSNHEERHSVESTLTKQTYSVYVETTQGRKKWHLIAYFTQETWDSLRTIDDYPELHLTVPPGMYRSARISRARPRDSVYQHQTQPSQIYDHPFPTFPFPSHASLPSNRDLLNGKRSQLAPLAYLNSISPPRRHIVDEMLLMSLPTHDPHDFPQTSYVASFWGMSPNF